MYESCKIGREDITRKCNTSQNSCCVSANSLSMVHVCVTNSVSPFYSHSIIWSSFGRFGWIGPQHLHSRIALSLQPKELDTPRNLIIRFLVVFRWKCLKETRKRYWNTKNWKSCMKHVKKRSKRLKLLKIDRVHWCLRSENLLSSIESKYSQWKGFWMFFKYLYVVGYRRWPTYMDK